MGHVRVIDKRIWKWSTIQQFW